ncbi:MAG: histidine kinase [Flavobacteriaceae bacterium]
MKLLSRHSVGIPKKYIYLISILFSFVVLLQTTLSESSGILVVSLKFIVFFTTNYLLWAVLIEYVYGAVKPIRIGSKTSSAIISTSLLNLLLICLIHLFISNIVYSCYFIFAVGQSFMEFFEGFKGAFFNAFLSRVFDFLIISVLLKALEAYKSFQQKQLKVLELENQLHLSQLATLRSQLDPHFLFNTLHTLNSLIGFDDKKARSIVIKITHLLRKMLQERDKHIIRLEEEIEYFKNYLAIEQERFNDRLTIAYDIDEATKQIEVPALILQPLIENAFKHGIALIEGKCHIHLTTKLEGNRLSISLSNTKPNSDKTSPVTSTKVGLKNLKSRLHQLFPDSFELHLNDADDLYTVVIILTLEKLS